MYRDWHNPESAAQSTLPTCRDKQSFKRSYRQAERCKQEKPTWMWSFWRKALSFLYSLETEFLSPNVKLINHRWWASFSWEWEYSRILTWASLKSVSKLLYSVCCSVVQVPQNGHCSAVLDLAGGWWPDYKFLYCPMSSATEAHSTKLVL